MKIPTLETGFRVETRNGEIYIVMAFENAWVLNCRPDGYMNKSGYDDSLKCFKDNDKDYVAEEYDIMKIYDRPENNYYLLNHDKYGSLLWQRNETELTAKEAFELMREICNKNGCHSCPLSCKCDPSVNDNDNDELLSILKSYKEEHDDV